jgi:bacterial/archaeal transporter family-2 protein
MPRRLLGIAVAAATGVAVAVQSRINGELGVRLADGIAAAVVSLAIGLLILALLMPASPAGRRGLAALRRVLRRRELRWWECLGGLCGAFMVATQGLTVGVLGVAIFTVALVAGQSASSLLVDRAGIGPAGRQPVTAARLIGAVLAALAVLLAVGNRFGDPGVLVLAVLPLLGGVTVAWQQAVNGRVNVATGSALAATLVNFTAGTAAVLLAFAVTVGVRGWPTGEPPTEPWLYLGGPIGVMFIAAAAVVVRVTGVLVLGLASIAGQVVGAVVIDLVLPTEGARPGVATLVGVALTLVAVGIAAVAPGRR